MIWHFKDGVYSVDTEHVKASVTHSQGQDYSLNLVLKLESEKTPEVTVPEAIGPANKMRNAVYRYQRALEHVKAQNLITKDFDLSSELQTDADGENGDMPIFTAEDRTTHFLLFLGSVYRTIFGRNDGPY